MRRAWCWPIVFSLLFSCSGGAAYKRLDSTMEMQWNEGKAIELEGRISETPWQHLMGNPPGFGYAYYFDVDRYQIVIYTRSPLACRGTLRVRGTVVRVAGGSKQPGAKADESYVEYHLAVDEWVCE